VTESLVERTGDGSWPEIITGNYIFIERKIKAKRKR
jgi:hypothetical protein